MKRAVILLALWWTVVPGFEDTSTQLVVVTTKGWHDADGLLVRYEKGHGQWHAVGRPIKVFLGRNGLGWGIGLHTVPANARLIKREGDGRSPAGIFALVHAFGYAPYPTRFPYRVYRESDHCVDDIRSRYYNRIVDSTAVAIDYRSKEHMKFPRNYYRYGVVVDHNHFGTSAAVSGRGSCIFLHIKERPTAGCTVMNTPAITTLIRWLDPKAKPLLVQGPKEIVRRLLGTWGPKIDP